MKILTVDIGTGTQDIFIFNSNLGLENGIKLVVPSPTMIVHQKIREATRRGQSVLLTGVTMGGGPSAWAAEDHIRAGFPLYATPAAARSFNDDLEKVQGMGVQIVGEDEAALFSSDVQRIVLNDFDLDIIAEALGCFGVSLSGLSAVAVAVFDHGEAPPDVSDRKFRFDYLADRIRKANRLSSFAFAAEEIPPSMTRLKAVAQSARQTKINSLMEIPLVVMDTAPAAALGATYDLMVRQQSRVMVANIGNLHTLAFRLGPTGIEGVFEHHTGLLNQQKLERLLRSLAAGELSNIDVYNDHGHGALILHDIPLALENDNFDVVVTGPRRDLMRGSKLKPYFAVPFGDMMITGCFGLLAAVADVIPEVGEPIRHALDGVAESQAPWDEV